MFPENAKGFAVFECDTYFFDKTPDIKNAVATVEIPENKRLPDLGEAEFSFGALSDTHMNYEQHNRGAYAKLGQKYKVIGWMAAFCPFLILGFYSVLAGMTLRYCVGFLVQIFGMDGFAGQGSGFFGYLLADSLGLWKPLKVEKKHLALTLAISVVGGIVFSLDHWVFGSFIDGIQEANTSSLTASNVIASVLYGGIIEEVMLRLFFMSAIALVIWKLFFRKYDREHIPTGVFVAANIIAALAFAAFEPAGHIHHSGPSASAGFSARRLPFPRQDRRGFPLSAAPMAGPDPGEESDVGERMGDLPRQRFSHGTLL